jgi:hypothetical protein
MRIDDGRDESNSVGWGDLRDYYRVVGSDLIEQLA